MLITNKIPVAKRRIFAYNTSPHWFEAASIYAVRIRQYAAKHAIFCAGANTPPLVRRQYPVTRSQPSETA
ncbi:MAG: hypothetical protein A2044_04680 [Candidatus Firestonebacteria bacterium GWA2_43_8]|nr:MAG: hypothetical protein A2044_04680 [Candidatus Firestonebacteria bacterium GWA2_43_8]